jgi:hypothetical protein
MHETNKIRVEAKQQEQESSSPSKKISRGTKAADASFSFKNYLRNGAKRLRGIFTYGRLWARGNEAATNRIPIASNNFETRAPCCFFQIHFLYDHHCC